MTSQPDRNISRRLSLGKNLGRTSKASLVWLPQALAMCDRQTATSTTWIDSLACDPSAMRIAVRCSLLKPSLHKSEPIEIRSDVTDSVHSRRSCMSETGYQGIMRKAESILRKAAGGERSPAGMSRRGLWFKGKIST